MEKDRDIQSLLDYAHFFLKFRPRSVKEMRDYLYRKIAKRHWSRDDVNEVLVMLQEQGLIDDASFVSWFVDQRVVHKPKSERVLKQELSRFGVEKDLIDLYFSKHPLDEQTLISKVIKKKWSRYAQLGKKERFQKVFQFLVRRGFSFDLARKAIGELESASS